MGLKQTLGISPDFNFYTSLLNFDKKFRWVIAAFWGVLVCAGLFAVPKVLTSTNSSFKALPGSPSDEALKVIPPLFPLYYSHHREYVFFKSKVDGASLVDGPVADKLFALSTLLGSNVKNEFSEVTRSTNFYDLDRTLDAELMARSLITSGNNTIIFACSHKEFKYDSHMMEFADYLQYQAEKLVVQFGLQDDVQTYVFGTASFGRDLAESSKSDIEKMDTRVLPIAFLVLAYVIKSLPLLFIPMLTIPASLMGQFLLMYPVTLLMDVVSYAPSVMMSLTLALGIDYSLFMLTRFMDGYKKKMSIEESIALMVTSAGHVIIVSCLTLFSTLACMLIFPMGMIRSIMLACLISISMSLLVNLTLVPVLLYLIGPFLMRMHERFALSKLKEKLREVCCCGPKEQEKECKTVRIGKLDGGVNKLNDEEKGDEEDPAGIPDRPARFISYLSGLQHCNDSDYEPRVKPKGIWFGIARFVSDKWRALGVVLTVVALIIPVAYQVKDLRYSMGMDLLIPVGTPSREGYDLAVKELGGIGHVFPYGFALQSKSGFYPDGLQNEQGFEAMQSIVQSILNIGSTDIAEFQSPVVANGEFIPWATYQAALTPGSPQFDDPLQKTLRMLNLLFFSQDKSAMLLMFSAAFDPFSQEGRKWLYEVRDLVDEEGSKLGLNVYIGGSAAICIDAVDGIFHAFRITAPVMLVVAFLMVGLFMKSIAAPVRSIFSLVLTLGFSYGFAVLVYQKGMLEFLHFAALGNAGAFMWFVVFLAFSLITGLSLDYDVFLATRILECRQEGYSNRASVVRGVMSTGSTITFAGIIMAIAFSGLLFSSSILLNQLACMLITAVLLDTFVIRAWVVPSLITLSGDYAWWPRKDLPKPNRVCKVASSAGLEK